MSEQLPLELQGEPSYAPGDFYPSEASAAARTLLSQPAAWPRGKLILVGPAGAGKTHLLRMWSAAHGALLADPAALPNRADRGVAVDDAQRVAGDKTAEETLFHLHNNLAAAGLPLLLTASAPPSRWGITLPDLRSRMEATTVATIDAPDDAALSAIVVKLMADRQLTPAPNLVGYLIARMGRSYGAAARTIDALDRLSLSEKRRITTVLAARVLDAGDD